MQLNKKDRGLSADVPMRGSCRLANGTSSNRNFLRSSSQINEISPATGPVKKIDVRSAHSGVDNLDIFPQDKLSSHQAADSLPSSNLFPSERYSASPELSLPLRQASSGAINNRNLALECEHLPAHDTGRTQMLSTHLSPLEPEMVVSSAQERLEGNRLNSSEHAETPLIKPEYSDGSASIIVTSTEGVNSCIDLNQEDLDIQSMSPDGLKSRLNADLGSGDIQNSSLRNEAEMSLHPGFAFRSSSNGVISRKVSFSNDRDSGRTPKECDTKDSPRIIKHIPGSDCDSGTPPPFTSEEKPASKGNREDIKIQIQSKFPGNECPESKASKTMAGQEVDPMSGRLPPTLTLSLSCLQVQIPHTKSSAIMYHVETLILEPLRRKLALQRDSSWALRILSLIALPLNIALFLTVVPILREQVAEEEIINDEEEVEDEAILQSARKICPKIPTDQHCNLPAVATSGNTPVLPPERVSVALQTNNTVTLQQLSSLAPNCRQARTESAIKRTNDLSVVSPDVLKFNLSMSLPASATSPSHSANIPSSPAIPISSLPLKNHGQELHGPSTQTSRLSFRGFGILRRANAVCTYQPSKSYVKFISILASLDNAIILRYRTLLLISPVILFSFTYSSLRWFTLPRILPQLPI
ncbi:hypothetical protein BKA69DRAFT_502337 [Paraphysoderma sedebokerense]|nr:hypothetical protein BKA69DRAFT_502337 [Paraphysoderma sedebokerense]